MAMFTYLIAFIYCFICVCNLNVMYAVGMLNVPVTSSYTKSPTDIILNVRICSDHKRITTFPLRINFSTAHTRNCCLRFATFL